MLFVVSYDVKESARRVRLAKRLLDLGERVQKSVFDCEMNPDAFEIALPGLLRFIDPASDSLRVYRLGDCCARKVAHHGVRIEPRCVEPGEDGIILL